jgi:2-polyprenyl-3-methyl-5-hydroxy-6-metoxy-1,4-benzoquinol methylase
MNNRLEKCPLCNSGLYHSYLDCKDYTVSQETFKLVECEECHFIFTNPRPNTESIGRYYESDKYISHTNKGNDLINSVYKVVRSFTLKSKRNLINRLAKRKGTLLDMGCGTGEFIHTCQQDGWKVKGIEPSPHARKQAEELNQTSLYSDLFQVEDSAQFDAITLWHVLEHVDDLQATVKKLKQLLKSDGVLVVAVPNYQSLDAQIYQEHWAAYDVPRHLYHFSQKSMEKLMNGHGLKIEQVLPMKLDSFYVSLLSEKYKTNKQNYFRAVWNGLKSNLWAGKHQNNYSSLIYIIRK